MNTSMTVSPKGESPVSPRPVFMEPLSGAETVLSHSANRIEPLPTSPLSESSIPTTPRRSVTPQECPGAPARPTGGRRLDLASPSGDGEFLISRFSGNLDDVRPMPLHIPSVADHKNKGILPDYFIKPEPGMPLWEKRKYVESELERWLTSPLFHQHVKDVEFLHQSSQFGVYDSSNDNVSNWPAWEAYESHRISQYRNENISIEESCQKLFQACVGRLEKTKLNNMWAGNIIECHTLSNGKTIRDYWDTSDLDGLREAEPLPYPHSEDTSASLTQSAIETEPLPDGDDEEEQVENGFGDNFGVAFTVKGETIDLDFQVKIPLKAILTWMVLWVSWLMLNTYVLCKDGGC